MRKLLFVGSLCEARKEVLLYVKQLLLIIRREQAYIIHPPCTSWLGDALFQFLLFVLLMLAKRIHKLANYFNGIEFSKHRL